MNQKTAPHLILSFITALVIGYFIPRGQSHKEATHPPTEQTHSSYTASSPISSSPLENFSFIAKNATKTEALSVIALYPDSLSRSQAILALIDTLAPDEFPSVVQHLEKSGLLNLRSPEYQLLLGAWAQIAPQDAIAYASKNTRGVLAKNTILETWATRNPKEALAWAQANHTPVDPDDANPWLFGVIRGVVVEDLDMASSLLFSLPESQVRDDALEVILGQLHAETPERAREWALAIENSEGNLEIRAKALAMVAKNMAINNPAEAAEWIASVNDADAFSRVAEEISYHRYRVDPEGTKEWIATLPSWAIGEAATAVVEASTKQDPIETAQWMSELLNTNPEGGFDEAIEVLVEEATQIDPQISAEWITGLTSERNQERLYHKVLSEWLENSEDNHAQAWIEFRSSDLPESILMRYLPDYIPEIDPMIADESRIHE